MIKSCNDAGLIEPEFIETGMFFKVVIKKSSGLITSKIKAPTYMLFGRKLKK